MEKGRGAVEEGIYRRTNMGRQVRGCPDARRLYPLKENICVITKGIAVLRGCEDDGYPFIEQVTPTIDVIACAAINSPRLDGRGRYQSMHDVTEMTMKAETILHAAESIEADILIMSAFGCGAFHNPPAEVAEIFKGVFKDTTVSEVVVCITDDHNAFGNHNPKGNYAPFQEILGQQLTRGRQGNRRPAAREGLVPMPVVGPLPGHTLAKALKPPRALTTEQGLVE